ncbi:MAG TPA: hypothetical protein VFG49_04450 [Dyella sp.]|uniref:hypothetical protein n=1 Tax=Dyella sp. TaxID=1869338 RepID=UPI002D775A59|nr:hypothetical protein [Dyella sp.]HET6552768.1 hypothetical protein [Dyella sp.]
MKYLLVAIAMLMVVGCSQYESQAKHAVQMNLKDPDSVQWGPIVSSNERDATYGKPHPIVCGSFNSKNSWGAYSGFEYFIWDDGVLHTGNEAEFMMPRCPSGWARA